MIFRRPDAGFADDFAAVDDEAADLSTVGDDDDESLGTGSIVGGLPAADAGETSTLVNVLCGSKLAATCVSTTPLRAYTPTEVSMLWVQVASQSMNVNAAKRVTLRVGLRISILSYCEWRCGANDTSEVEACLSESILVELHFTFGIVVFLGIEHKHHIRDGG